MADADLADALIEQVLEGHKAASSALRGIREILNWHVGPVLRIAPDLMERTALRNGFSLLQGSDLSFDRQIYWQQMEQTVALARLGRSNLTSFDTVPLLARTIDIFSPERIMVGTNLSVDRLFAEGSMILDTIMQIVSPLSEYEAYAVLSRMAERLYRISAHS